MRLLNCGMRVQKVMALEQGSGYLCSRLAARRDLLQCLSA
jgi:hypothetical protein